jgi:hypothetical protein
MSTQSGSDKKTTDKRVREPPTSDARAARRLIERQSGARLQHAQSIDTIRSVLGDRCRMAYGGTSTFLAGDPARRPRLGTPALCRPPARTRECCQVAIAEQASADRGYYLGPSRYTPYLPTYFPAPPSGDDAPPLQTFMRDFFLGQSPHNGRHDWRPWLWNAMDLPRKANGCLSCAGHPQAACERSPGCKWGGSACANATTMALYQAMVNRWARRLALTPKSYIRGLMCVWTPGAGKTAAAIQFLSAFAHKRCLVISAPQIIRNNYEQWVRDGMNTLPLGPDQAILQGRVLAIKLLSEQEERTTAMGALPSARARRQLLLTIESSAAGGVVTRRVYAKPVSTPASTSVQVEPQKRYAVRPTEGARAVPTNARCWFRAHGDGAFEFSNNYKETLVIMWMKTCGTGPGLDVDLRGLAGDSAYENNGFLSYAQLHNAIERGKIDPNKCVAVFDEVQWLTNPADNAWKNACLNLLDWLVSGDPRFAQFNLLTLSATPGETAEQLYATLMLNHAPHSPLRKTVRADDIRFTVGTDRAASEKRDAALERFMRLALHNVSYVDAYNARNVFPTSRFANPTVLMPYLVRAEMSPEHRAAYVGKVKKRDDRRWRDRPYEERQDWLAGIRKLVNVPEPQADPDTHQADYETPERLRTYCPKLYELWRRLASPGDGGRHDVSGPADAGVIRRTDRHFVTVPLVRSEGGYREVAAALRLCRREGESQPAFVEWNPPDAPALQPGQKYFVCYAGSVGHENAVKLQQKLHFFNGDATGCTDNPGFYAANGTYDPPCTVFVASGGFNEAYSLCLVRYMHFWGAPVYKREFLQVLGRANRNCSHAMESLDRWDVYVLAYLSTLADGPDLPPSGGKAGASDGRSGADSAQPECADPNKTCTSDATMVLDTASGVCIPRSRAIALRNRGEVQCFDAAVLADAPVHPLTRDLLKADEMAMVEAYKRTREFHARDDSPNTGVTASDDNVVKELGNMLQSTSVDEYALAVMLLQRSLRDYYMEALQVASLDCKLLSAFHGMSETQCIEKGGNGRPTIELLSRGTRQSHDALARRMRSADAYTLGYVPRLKAVTLGRRLRDYVGDLLDRIMVNVEQVGRAKRRKKKERVERRAERDAQSTAKRSRRKQRDAERRGGRRPRTPDASQTPAVSDVTDAMHKMEIVRSVVHGRETSGAR